MRLLSPHARYSIQVIEAEEQVVVDARGMAQSIVLKKPVVANFEVGGLLDHEQEYALVNFGFSGLPDRVNPLTRVSCFDTEAYVQRFPENQRDEMAVQIEKRFREIAPHHPNEFHIVPMPSAERPWPSYDDDTAEDVIKFVERLRIKPTTVRLYELENKNRPEVVMAMLRKEDPEAAKRYEAELSDAGGAAQEEEPQSETDSSPAANMEPVSVEA